MCIVHYTQVLKAKSLNTIVYFKMSLDQSGLGFALFFSVMMFFFGLSIIDGCNVKTIGIITHCFKSVTNHRENAVVEYMTNTNDTFQMPIILGENECVPGMAINMCYNYYKKYEVGTSFIASTTTGWFIVFVSVSLMVSCFACACVALYTECNGNGATYISPTFIVDHDNTPIIFTSVLNNTTTLKQRQKEKEIECIECNVDTRNIAIGSHLQEDDIKGAKQSLVIIEQP